MARRGYCYRSYFADPDEWCNCFKVAADGPPGLWRRVFPTDPALSVEELMSDEAVQARLQKFLPADEPYELVLRTPYMTHHGVATIFRDGALVLDGDAAQRSGRRAGQGPG